jgi:hypothetical protein
MSEIKALYKYRNEKGKVVYEQVRFVGKKFAFRRRLQNGEFEWGLKDTRRVLYNLPSIRNATEVLVPEGEKDADTLTAMGFTSTTNPGGAGKWRDEFSQALKGKRIYILADNDKPGRKHAKSVAKSVRKYTSEVFLVSPFPGAKDVSEWIEKGGTKKQLQKFIANATPIEQSGAVSTAAAEGGNTTTTSPDDWRLKPVRGSWAVALPEGFFLDYLVLPKGISFVASLWVIGTHIFKVFDCFPYLSITSPTKRCGKTRFAEILELLCARPLMSVNISEAALFRSIAADQPTVIIDEAEALRNKDSERAQYLLSILQAGYREGAYVLRCVGKGHDVERFPVYCPKAVLAIGNLPETLMDRSLVISMRRRLTTEIVARFRRRVAAQQASGIVNAITSWVEKHKEEIRKAYLKQDLAFLKDREADIWEPLFAIASVAAPERLEELKQIALRLSGQKVKLDADDALSIRLLEDIRAVFQSIDQKKLRTDQLIFKLKVLPETQWDDLTPIKLARMLRPFGVSPGQLGFKNSNPRGYDFAGFKPVFDRYLAPATR